MYFAKAVLIAVTAASVSAAAFAAHAQSPVTLPATPAGTILRAWLEAFNSGDSLRLDAYYRQYDVVRGGYNLRRVTGGVDLIRVEHTEPRHIEVTLKERSGPRVAYFVLTTASDGSMKVATNSIHWLGANASVDAVRIDGAARARVIEGALARFDTWYVFPDIAKQTGDSLRSRLRRGAYDPYTTGPGFAARLHDELREITRDKHVQVAYSVAAAAPAPSQPAGPPPSPAQQKQAQEAGVKRVKEMIEAINTGDSATIRAYFDGQLDPNGSGNAFHLYKQSRGYDLLRVELVPNRGDVFAGIVRKRITGDEDYLAARIEPQAPYRITLIQFRVDEATVNSWKLKRAVPAPAAAFIDETTKKVLADASTCGFVKVEVLPGNIGYLKFNEFANPSLCAPTASAAMDSLAGTKALIVDLRENSGGSPAMVSHISSYLFSQRTQLNSLWNRNTGQTTEYWTNDDVPGRKFGGDKPVYVLTAARTFSAAEAFTYDLKSLQRAVIIGETTGGGAHTVRSHRIDDHFTIRVPYTRAINPITKTNWEGVGVEPDVKVPASEALTAALRLLAEKAKN